MTVAACGAGYNNRAMIRLNILYPNTPGHRFDLDYYLGVHVPMSRQLFGDALKDIVIERGIAGAEMPPAYIVSCHMLFDSIEAFVGAWARIGERLDNDIPQYTDLRPVIQFSVALQEKLPPVALGAAREAI